MALTGQQKKAAFDAKLRAIKHHANVLLGKKIKAICKRDKSLYNGLFTYPVILRFSRQEKIAPTLVVNILLRDLYIIFTAEDAKDWNIYKSDVNFYIMNMKLTNLGFINREGVGEYYLTLKGKSLVKDFNSFYDKQVKIILKKTGNGDPETIRKILRAKPPREYKPRDYVAGKKPV